MFIKSRLVFCGSDEYAMEGKGFGLDKNSFPEGEERMRKENKCEGK